MTAPRCQIVIRAGEGGCSVFFAAGQPRTRRIFLRDERGRITGFVDRREGEEVRWRRRDGP